MNRVLTDAVVAMLHNRQANRWHPVYFEPWPGADSPASGVRHKSAGHHAEGFSTRLEALAAAKHLAGTMVETGCASACKMALGEDIEWNGEGLPAMVAVFAELADGTLMRRQRM